MSTDIESELGLSPSLTPSEILGLFIDACGDSPDTEALVQKTTVVCVPTDASRPPHMSHPVRRSTREHKIPAYVPGMLVGNAAKIDLRSTRQVPNWATSKSDS